ncbi:MAG: division/cell wall cluster transcriptional repressor MraZ [Cytophagaceae bacterium]|nr:division/cell wall cluster transcriptional repressor MraZ [Cytophagaceae bacterium]MDW8455427.1 division/cell wall cluster transcriptional repressor MraZ [Cytophagaceae bacterium]
MSYLSGEYECKIDAKGRIVLPARLKSNLPGPDVNNIVINRGFEPCLVIYPEAEWRKVFSRVSGLNEFNEEYRSFQRNFFRGSTDVELDANGRFVIPPTMRKYAQLETDAIVVGMGNRMELWAPALYEQFLTKDQKEFSKMAEKYLGDKANDVNPST